VSGTATGDTLLLAYPLKGTGMAAPTYSNCALLASKIIKTYTYYIRSASRSSHVKVMKPSGMLRPFLQKPPAGIPAPNAFVSDLPHFESPPIFWMRKIPRFSHGFSHPKFPRKDLQSSQVIGMT